MVRSSPPACVISLWKTCNHALPSILRTPQARNQLLASAADSGVINNYEGWRVSLKGRKFRIKGVTLFNVEDAEGA